MIPLYKSMFWNFNGPEFHYKIFKLYKNIKYFKNKDFTLESQVLSLPVRNQPRNKISKRRFNRER